MLVKVRVLVTVTVGESVGSGVKLNVGVGSPPTTSIAIVVVLARSPVVAKFELTLLPAPNRVLLPGTAGAVQANSHIVIAPVAGFGCVCVSSPPDRRAFCPRTVPSVSTFVATLKPADC